jgi:arylsulfatase
MEVYAGFMEHTDHHAGRFIDALAELEVLDDTLVYCIICDNGASAEGDLHGSFNELINLNGATALQTTEFMASRIDEFGTPEAYNHYAVGWAHAMDTPYQWTKQIASHWGGTRTARSCTGPPASGHGARSAPSSTTSSTSPRPSSKPPRFRRR